MATRSGNKWPENIKEGPEQWRRSLYIFVKRSIRFPMMETFDSPDPSAWLYRAAKNNLIGEFRKRNRRDCLLEEHSREELVTDDASEVSLLGEMQDSLLRMLFVCCDENISVWLNHVHALLRQASNLSANQRSTLLKRLT